MSERGEILKKAPVQFGVLRAGVFFPAGAMVVICDGKSRVGDDFVDAELGVFFDFTGEEPAGLGFRGEGVEVFGELVLWGSGRGGFS